MSNFWKSVVATILGLIIFVSIVSLVCCAGVVGSLSSSSSSPSISSNSVLVMNMNGMVEERGIDNPLSEIFGNGITIMGLNDIVNAINKAKDNDDIKGIYMQFGAYMPDSWATNQAIRRALADFRKSGKWIISYADTYTQGAYYLASVGDKIFLNPEGMIDWHGIGSNPMYLKDLMAKFGIKMQLAKVGTYKSAPEMFVADKMSDANREQTMAYMTSIWNQVLTDVSESRKISTEQLNEYADRLITFDDPKDVLKTKMIDKLTYADEVKTEIKKLLGLDEDESINQVSIASLNNLETDESGDEIAVYYAFGDIVQTNAEQSITSGGQNMIVGEDLVSDFAALAADDNVKAVVIRVNSGGGSAYASEQIWRAIEMLKKKKPVVISMGGMAASGGYYMSCNSNWIVAESTTITGSIGIFGMFPDFSELMTQKLGIKFDEVKTNKNSTFGSSMSRPFNADEMAMIEKYVQRGYETFIKRVGDGRKMTREQVDSIGQGHVYTAADAKKLRLVDEIGGLDAALKKAASLAKLDKYHACDYPAQKQWYEDLLQQVSDNSNTVLDDKLKATLGELYQPMMLIKSIKNQDALQARIPYIINMK